MHKNKILMHGLLTSWEVYEIMKYIHCELKKMIGWLECTMVQVYLNWSVPLPQALLDIT